MDKKTEHHEPTLSTAFKRDLTALYHDPRPVPEDLSRKIRNRVCLQIRSQPRRRILRWALSAAAVIVICVGVVLVRSYKTQPQQVPLASRVPPAADFDRNGTVNILDAFWLARQLQTIDHIDQQWDLNTDGQVNQADVNLVAQLAVRLDPQEVL